MAIEPRLLEKFEQEQFICNALFDAYALVDVSGKVLRCNSMFEQLVDQSSNDLLEKKNIFELFEFSLNSKVIAPDEILSPTPNRIDEVSLKHKTDDDNKKNANIILASYPFKDDLDSLGHLIIIRDVSVETELQGKYEEKSNQTFTDGLTGLRNRNYLQSIVRDANRIIEAFKRSDGDSRDNICVVMADIDKFKSINDQLGHQFGDYVLKEVSTIFKKIVRKTDVICRYGGEEFLFLLYNSDKNQGKMVAEKLRQCIQESAFVFEGKEREVTCSFGVSHIEKTDNEVNSIVKRADTALYEAKETGRNKVVVK